MSRTKRLGSSKTAQRVVPLVVGAAVAVGSAVLLSGDPATASAKTVTVTFTADGPSPKSVSLAPGDTVQFVNDVPKSSGSLLGSLTGPLEDVKVTVSGATAQPFSMDSGAAPVSVTYPTAVTANYSATYDATLLIGLPAGTSSTSGSVTVTDPKSDTPPPASSGSGTGTTPPPAQGGGGSSSSAPGGGSSTGGSSSSGGGTGSGAAAGGPHVNYTPHGSDPADAAVPHGSGAPQGSGQAQQGSGTAAQPGGATLPGDGSQVTLPDAQVGSSQGSDTSGSTGPATHVTTIDRASSDHSLTSLGMPAILAVVLLSMVSAGLVRTIMVRYAAPA